MAKYTPIEKTVAPTYPSLYGSHKSMIDSEATRKLKSDLHVVCKDEKGLYVTERSMLDSGRSDGNRYIIRTQPENFKDKK